MTQDEKDNAGSPTGEMPPSDHTVTIEVPRELGCYRLSNLLGRGGMGEVWQAFDTHLERDVAIKLMRKELSENVDAARRFTREARAVARLNHHNIVQVYAFGDEKGLHYFAMELVEGETVTQCLKRQKRIPLRDTVNIMVQAIEGLGYAYARGIIHRDIKPSNLMLTKEGHVKIADFGLAKMVEHDTQMTAAGTAMGSPNYMSPEQARGDEADHRSDIYALGVSMYQMLCGDLPFTANSPVAVLLKQIQDPLPEHEMIKCINDGAALAVIKKMTEKKPEARYQSYAELAAALADLTPDSKHRGAHIITSSMPTPGTMKLDDDSTATQSAGKADMVNTAGGPTDPGTLPPPTPPPVRDHPALATPSEQPPLAPTPVEVPPKSSKASWFIGAAILGAVVLTVVAWVLLKDQNNGVTGTGNTVAQRQNESSEGTAQPPSAVTTTPAPVNSPLPATQSNTFSANGHLPGGLQEPLDIVALVTPVISPAPGVPVAFTPTPSITALMPESVKAAPTAAPAGPQILILALEGAGPGASVPAYLDKNAKTLYKNLPMGTEVTLISDGTPMVRVLPAGENRPVFVHKKMTQPKP